MKVAISQHGTKQIVTLDGIDVSGSVSAADVRIRPNEVPVITLDVPFESGLTLLDKAEVDVCLAPESLQQAALIIQRELQQKGDWYNALVGSIAEYLKHVTAKNGLYDIAYGLADLLIGD